MTAGRSYQGELSAGDATDGDKQYYDEWRVRASAGARAADADYAGFGLEPGRRTLLVFGGSRGAATLNRAVEAACARIVHDTEWQVLAQTGQEDLDSTRTIVTRACGDRPSRVRVLPFIEDMGAAWPADRRRSGM